MEDVVVVCDSCTSLLGEFANIWTQIGKSYYSPVVAAQVKPDIQPHGPLRSGEEGTLVEGCQLQDIACASCGVVLGIRCISSPVNHVLEENQILFKASAVQAHNDRNGQTAQFVVNRQLKLRDGPRTSTGRPRTASPNGFRDGQPSAEISLLHAELEAQRSDIERIDSAGFKVISGLDDAVNRVEGDLNKMRDTLSGLRQDLRGNHDDMASLKTEIKEVKKQAQDKTTVMRLQEELDSANESIGAVRQELHKLSTRFDTELDKVKAELRQHKKEIDDLKTLSRDPVTAREHAKDVAAMRGELAQLRKQMEEKRATPAGPFPARELDILTSNITKIGNRANQVESLQMEFEIFKGRLERMEAATHATQSRQPPVSTAETTSAYDRYDDHDYHTQDLRSLRRKRPSSGLDISPLPASSSKRAAISSDVADTIVATQWSDDQPSSPLAESRTRPDLTRLTKSGKVDKRTQRPARRSLIGISAGDKAYASKRKG